MRKRFSISWRSAARSAARAAAGAAAFGLVWTFATGALAQQQTQQRQSQQQQQQQQQRQQQQQQQQQQKQQQSPAQQQVEKGRVENIKVHGRSLEGNLSGESPDRDVSVYLPPGYDRDTSRRYPVVYLLHGYSLTNRYWIGTSGQGFGSIDVPGAMDRDIASGKSRPMILVMPNGDSKYDGSMYSNSVTSGNWEGFIADDLVAYVDSHYRTIADRESRGLAGHSMGGYGTIRIGMKRPDAFSSLYILSACCLTNDANAMARRQPANGGGFANVLKAEAAAWSPNPKNPPDYFDMPGGEGPEAALVAAKWAANSPLAMIDQYIPHLRMYSGIGMDVGRQDGLAASNEQLANVLAAYGIEHVFETYEGNHVNRIAERMEQKVLPFFSQHLDFGAKDKD